MEQLTRSKPKGNIRRGVQFIAWVSNPQADLIKKYWNTVFLELYIKYLSAWQCLSVGMRSGVGMPLDKLDTLPLE